LTKAPKTFQPTQDSGTREAVHVGLLHNPFGKWLPFMPVALADEDA